MPDTTNRQIVLAARPKGAPKPGDFRMVESAVPEAGEGEVVTRTIYLSLDPYMRGRMNDAKSYAPSVEIGGVMTAGAASQVIASRNSAFTEGDFVFGYTGWQDYAVTDGKGLRRLDPRAAPISTSLGVLGMPGMTAWAGLKNIGQPKKGETLVVAAASGAVGGLVGQIARLQGARAVGIAGSAEKCAYVTGELGFDACINHRDSDFAEQLAKACPEGIDIYWENVGGPVFEAVLPLLNPFGRVPVCGLIAHYNATALPEGPNKIPLLMRSVLSNRLRVQGFIVFDFADQESGFLAEMTSWVQGGRIRFREDFVDGLENAPAAFIGMLEGGNFGKLVVRVAPEPAR
ncbi:MAG: NADP-dependent oxidoreductase [Hyphomicrobiales bacterium]